MYHEMLPLCLMEQLVDGVVKSILSNCYTNFSFLKTTSEIIERYVNGGGRRNE